MASTSDTRTVSFTETGSYLEAVRGESNREAKDFLTSILKDLHRGDLPDLIDPDPVPFLIPVPVDAQNRYGRPIQHLEWFEGSEVSLQFMYGAGLKGTNSPLELDFDLVWLNLSVDTPKAIRVAPASMRGLRSEMITTLYDRNPNTGRGVLEERCVLLVTIDGTGYEVPELTVVGPSRRTKKKEGEEESYSVNIVHFPFDDLAENGSRAADFTDRLNSQLSALARRGDGWKDAFRQSVETLSQARNQFREKLRKELQTAMALFEETYEEEAAEDELNILRQAASLLAYRVMFLQELERRGRLYKEKPSPAPLGDQDIHRSLVEELAYRGPDSTEQSTHGALLARLVHTVRVIRGDLDDSSIAVTGASIFDNTPSNFDSRIGDWLTSIESLVDEGDNAELLRAWDECIQKLGAVMLGHLDDEYRHEVNLIGGDAERFRHRVLGNIYEQILAMNPKREEGTVKLVRPENDEDDDRSSLGAHYTPIELVEEVVRPTLGQLFRQFWEEAEGDVDAYRESIRKMTVVDPAMGSAHFLTVAALEIARELAWLEFFDKPRIEMIEDWDKPLQHHNSIGNDPEPNRETEENSDDGSRGREKTGGQADDRFYDPTRHNDYVGAVRKEISAVIQRSIYGVDKNALATELGKLSLWLFEVGEVDNDDEMGTYPELTYLDANIRCGDSLIGVFLSDVEETIDNALRSKNSFDGRQQTMFGMMNQTESVEEALSKTKAFREVLKRISSDPGSFEPANLSPEIRDSVGLHGGQSAYVVCREIDNYVRQKLSTLEWVFDLTLAIRYLGYTSSSGARRAGRLYRALFDAEPPGSSISDVKPPIESALLKLFEEPESDASVAYRENLQKWLHQQDDIDPFHWDIEFPNSFQSGGFNVVLANPPFIGDRDLNGRLGSSDLVDFLASYFIPQNKKSEYAGFFFWRYHQIVHRDTGVVGSLATNSIAQASNREYITKPLTAGDSSPFQLFRALPNREWPGEANVHFAALYLSRQASKQSFIVRPDFAVEGHPERAQYVDRISSYMDKYPDFDLREMLHEGSTVAQGFILRGNFSVHRQPGESLTEAVEAVPVSERDALVAYLNADDVQQNPQATPSDVVIDFFEPLKQAGILADSPSEQESWLEENYPRLFEQIQARSPHAPEEKCVAEQRSELNNDAHNRSHKDYWWLFGSVRQGLRSAWESVDDVIAFPRVIKVWTPFRLPKHLSLPGGELQLRICPMDKIYSAPRFGEEHFAVTASFLFEMIVRRQCGTLKSDLNFSPTDVFPYFPWPWEPIMEDGGRLTSGEPDVQTSTLLQEAAQSVLELRTSILQNPTAHDLTRQQVGGPTDLYNLFDADPSREGALEGADSNSIDQLREAHVAMLRAVVDAYGWHDLSDQLHRSDWTFDHPWLDRSKRFVPPESVRAELFKRIDEKNSERFETECNLLTDYIIDHLPSEGLTKTGFNDHPPFSGLPIDADTFEMLMEREEEVGEDTRVQKSGYRWKVV